MKTDKLLNIAKTALDDLKAIQINVLDVRHLTSITDYMIIASGTSDRQVTALANKLIETVKKAGIKPVGVEGENQGEWALVDLGDIIVHIMHPQTREYYQLEKLWGVNVIPQQNSSR